MKLPIIIRIFKDEQLVEVKQFTEQQILIGSQDDAAIVLQDADVAAVHAVIEERDTGYYICDLGSPSGTHRNGEKILDSQLEPGDQIKIGSFVLEYFKGAAKPKAPPQVAKPTTPPPPPAQPAAPQKVETKPPASPPPATPPQAPAKPTLAAVKPPPPPAPEPAAPIVAATQPQSAPAPQPQPAPPTQATPPAQPAPKTKPTPPPASRDTTPAEKVQVPQSAPYQPPVRAKHDPKAKRTRWGKTFAPASEIKDLAELVRPTRGNVVQVVTSWRERALNTYHFSQQGTITIGGSENDHIILPVFPGGKGGFPLLKLGGSAMVFLKLDMPGLLRKDNKQAFGINELMGQNRLIAQSGGLYGLMLEQGEVLRIDFPNDVSVYVRYVSGTSVPKMAPFFDFTSTELTGFVMSMVLTGILALYFALYTPPVKDQNNLDDQPIRTAVFLYKPPPTPKAPQEIKPEKTKVPIVREQKKKTHEQPKTIAKIGKAAEMAPKPRKHRRPKLVTSIKHGGAIKVGEHRGANMKSVPKRDVTKTGLLGVFGSKGAQSQLDQAYSGPGELQGLANQASGYAGQNVDRPGEDLGSSIKDTGAGGKGTATVGIAGVGTRGRGFGKAGYGTGGLGTRARTMVIPGGQDEEFVGQIDRDAIRRVVQSHLREVQYCYERELDHDPNLSGKVVVQWKIGDGGVVVTARVKSSTMGRASVGHCLVARLKTWKFPDPPPNNIPIVTYPFVFEKTK